MQQFLILWFGQLVSLIGSQLTSFALSVWVYQQTHSTTLFAFLLGLNTLPVILLSPLIGTLADRLNRQRVMLFSDFSAGLSTVALAIAIHINYLPIGLIATLILVNATFTSFMQPTFTAATSQLVPAKYLDRASGLNQISHSVAQLLAPVLGGVLLMSIGLSGIILIDVGSFVIAVLTQIFIRIPNLPLSTTEHPTESIKTSALKAIEFLKVRPGLIALLAFFVVKNGLTSIVYVATTPYVLSFASSAVLGSIFSIGGLGMVAGGIILSILPESRSRIQTIMAFCGLSGLTLMVLAIQNSVTTFMVGSFLFFFGLPLLHGSGQVIFQRKVPTALQGRVFAFNEAIAGASVPLGYLLAGPLSDLVFEPLMQPNGLLANSVGQILGVGPGRGIALLFVVVGLCHATLAGLIALYKPLRNLEQLLPDASEKMISDHIPDNIPAKLHRECHAEVSTVSPKISNLPADQQSPMNPIISIKNLNHSFGKGSLSKQVLIDINLSIEPGEIVIMTGPSGSGKTTLLTLMGALRSVQDGSLTVLGHELNNASNSKLVQVRRNIGYIFQGHNLLPFMTARQNVRMSLSLKNQADRKGALQRVDHILDAVGLGNHLNHYPEKLSGGQKQRVAIARALVNEPALILADEPTASLDSKTGRDVVELMYRLAKEKQCTILLVTHDNRILDIADRIIALEDGRLKPSSSQSNLTLFNPAVSTGYVEVYGNDPYSSPVATGTPPTQDVQQELPPIVWQPTTSTSQPTDPLQLSKPSGITPTQTGWIPPNTIPKVAKNYTIACIDDSPTILYSLKAFLSDSLFSVVLIQDPIQALVQLIMANPDMVIVDINMPKLDGYQLCTLLREHKTFKHIPVIVITGDPRSLDPVLLHKAGVTDYLTKPFERSDLMIKLFPYLT
ncbi:MAG TPA: MFS transporter [Stenomitos sp.]